MTTEAGFQPHRRYSPHLAASGYETSDPLPYRSSSESLETIPNDIRFHNDAICPHLRTPEMRSFQPIGSCPSLPPEQFEGRPLFGSSLGPTMQPFTRMARLTRDGRASGWIQRMNFFRIHRQFGPLARAVASGHCYGAELHKDGPLPTFCPGLRLKGTRHRGFVSSGLYCICNAIAMQVVAGPLSILKSQRVNRQSRRSSERRPTELGDRRECPRTQRVFRT